LFTAREAGATMERRASVRAIEGVGLQGDRYAPGRGAFSRWPGARRQVTLVMVEALAAAEAAFDVSLSNGEHRRNIVVAGVPLEALVRRRFRVGEAVMEGVQVCAPCRYLVRVTGQPAVFDALVGRGGLRAQVLEGGRVREGDAVVVLDAGTAG
jgi:MOSC domain-containing protein YiiM